MESEGDSILASDLSEKDRTAIVQSSVFIEDALNYRTIHHKIDRRALRVYRAYHSGIVKWLTSLSIVVIMVLAFFEYPSSFSLSADYRYRNHTRILPENPPCGVTESIEGTCLLLFVVDATVQVYLIGGKRFLKKPWLILYVVLVVLSLVDLVASLGFRCDVDSYGFTLRLRRFCRPLFLLISSNIMKKFAKSIKDTLPQIFAVLFLLFLHLFTFSMIGTVVFSSHSNITNMSSLEQDSAYDDFVEAESVAYFHTIWRSLINLLVTMTTANHPDIMMPLYQYNRFSAIFFMVFLVIGNYIIFNLLTAVIYNQFKNQWVTSMQNSLFRQRLAIKAAFVVLPHNSKQQNAMATEQKVVSKTLLRHLIRNTHIPSSQLPLLYSKLEPLPSTLLSWREFQGIFDAITQGPLVRRKRGRPRFTQRGLRCFQSIVQHKLFAYFTVLVVSCHLILIVIEISIDRSQLESVVSRLAYYNIIFPCWYVTEHLVRFVGYGPREYFKSWTNLYSGVVTATIFIMELLILLLYGNPFGRSFNLVSFHTFSIMVRVLTVLTVLRVLTIISYIQALSQIITMLFDLLKNLRGFFGILVIVYYLFALLGMELFLNTERSFRADSEMAHKCGTFENLDYFANNFHDFASSLVTLWDIMVVNNWMVFLEAYTRVHGPWSQLYFIAWWVVSVVICLHLFVSILLDTFLKKWQDFHAHTHQQQPPSHNRPSPIHTTLEEPSRWNIQQSMEHVQVGSVCIGSVCIGSVHRECVQVGSVHRECVQVGSVYIGSVCIGSVWYRECVHKECVCVLCLCQ